MKFSQVIKQAVDDKSEGEKASDFSYQVKLDSKTQAFELSNLKPLQTEIEEIGRNINLLLTDSKKSSSQTTQIERSPDDENFSKVKIFIFYSFFIFIIFSIIESKPFYSYPK